MAAQKDSGSYLFSSPYPSVFFNFSLLKFARLRTLGPDPKSISRLLSRGWGLGAGHRKARCSPPVLIIPQSLPRKFPNAQTSHPESSFWVPLGAVCHLPLLILDRVASGQTRGAISNVAQLLRRVGKVSVCGTPPAPRDYCPAVPTETSPLTKMGGFLSMTLFLNRRM